MSFTRDSSQEGQSVGSPASRKRHDPLDMSYQPNQPEMYQINAGTPTTLAGHPLLIRSRVAADPYVSKMKNGEPWFSASLESIVVNPVRLYPFSQIHFMFSTYYI